MGEFPNAVPMFDARFWNGELPDTDLARSFRVYFGKCSQGTWVIPQFHIQQTAADQLGLGRSAWVFFQYSANMLAAATIYHRAMSAQGYGQFPPIVDIEDIRAPRDRSTFDRAWALVQEVESLSGREALIYSAAWYWDPWIKPFTTPEHPIYTRKLWESDPEPDTREPGFFDKGDLVAVQLQLDIRMPGFTEDIDIGDMRREYFEQFMGADSGEPLVSVKLRRSVWEETRDAFTNASPA